jgi:hypothetical protein
MVIQSLSRKCRVASLAAANTGSPHVAPPSVEVDTEMPEKGIGPEKSLEYRGVLEPARAGATEHGSRERMLEKSGPGLRKPRSLKERPRSSERATPAKLRPRWW